MAGLTSARFWATLGDDHDDVVPITEKDLHDILEEAGIKLSTLEAIDASRIPSRGTEHCRNISLLMRRLLSTEISLSTLKLYQAALIDLWRNQPDNQDSHPDTMSAFRDIKQVFEKMLTLRQRKNFFDKGHDMSRALVSGAAKPAQRDSIRYSAREEGRVKSTGSRV